MESTFAPIHSLQSVGVLDKKMMNDTGGMAAPVVEYRIPVKIGGRPPHQLDNAFDDSQRYRSNYGKLNSFGDRLYRDSPPQRFRGYHGSGRWNKPSRQRNFFSEFNSQDGFHPYAIARNRNACSSRPNYQHFRSSFRFSKPHLDYGGNRNSNVGEVYGIQSHTRPFSPIRNFNYADEETRQHRHPSTAMHASRMRFATHNNMKPENEDRTYQSNMDCGTFSSKEAYAIYCTDSDVSDVCTCDSECSCEHYCPENYQLDASVPKRGTKLKEIENDKDYTDSDRHSPLARARSRSRRSSSTSEENLSFISSDSSILTNEDSGLSSMGSGGEKLSLPVSPDPENVSEIGEDALIKSDADAYTVVYLEAKSARVFDETGKTGHRTASCYAIWFGDGDTRNVFREVPPVYNQERGKSAYILAVSQALSIVKEDGTTNQVQILMGSEFVMSNLKSWISHMKVNTEPTNWTEHKHHFEIGQLLNSMDGMLMKFVSRFDSVFTLAELDYLYTFHYMPDRFGVVCSRIDRCQLPEVQKVIVERMGRDDSKFFSFY